MTAYNNMKYNGVFLMLQDNKQTHGYTLGPIVMPTNYMYIKNNTNRLEGVRAQTRHETPTRQLMYQIHELTI